MSKLQAAMAGQKAITPYEMFRAQLEKLRPEIAGLCGKENVDRFMRVCLNAIQANPDVLLGDRRSLLISCLKAAQDNLLPDGREAVLTIFNTKVKREQREEWVKLVQYMPMAYGLVQKIYEAGATLVDAVPVFERDAFDYQRGDEPKITHRPYGGDDEPGKVVAAYVIIKLRTGETKREVVFRRDVEKARQASKAPNGPMWKDWYDQGAVKTVIHRVGKQLPRAEAFSRALLHDREVTGLKDVVEAVPAEPIMDVSALIDGRMDAELRDAALRARGGPEQPASEKAEQPEAKKAERPGEATPELHVKFLERYKTAKDSSALAEAGDEARLYKWTAEQQAELTRAYTASLTELED